jgi:hypothetical protein
MLNSGQVELLDTMKLVNQLCALERRTERSGKDSIDHAPNAHDDVANAAAGLTCGSIPGRVSAPPRSAPVSSWRLQRNGRQGLRPRQAGLRRSRRRG